MQATLDHVYLLGDLTVLVNREYPCYSSLYRHATIYFSSVWMDFYIVFNLLLSKTMLQSTNVFILNRT